MISTSRNEAKYQLIKLVKSGRSLREAKAMLRTAAMALDPEYTSLKDMKALTSLEGGLYSLTKSRPNAKAFSKVKFMERKDMIRTREEHIARWVTGYGGQGSISWERDGNLVRRGKPNKPRPNSSKGKVGKTRVIGATETLNDFKRLVSELKKLVAKGDGRTGNVKQLQKAYKLVRTSASVK